MSPSFLSVCASYPLFQVPFQASTPSERWAGWGLSYVSFPSTRHQQPPCFFFSASQWLFENNRQTTKHTQAVTALSRRLPPGSTWVSARDKRHPPPLSSFVAKWRVLRAPRRTFGVLRSILRFATKLLRGPPRNKSVPQGKNSLTRRQRKKTSPGYVPPPRDGHGNRL